MKKGLITVLILFGVWVLSAVFVSAVSFDDIDSQGVSLKAGPSDPMEGVAITWIESALYPKNVEKGREVFVEVKLTSKVKNVVAEFDFDAKNEKATLYSEDGLSWSRVYKTPENVSGGVHVAKIVIEAKNGRKITRTLDFAVVDSPNSFAQSQTYPVSVIKTVSVVDNGQTVSQLLPGIKVIALYKAPFYRVKLADGKEGWIEASRVKDPSEEFYLLGYKSFKERNYVSAEAYYLQTLEIDPNHLRALYWLAKTYSKMGSENAAVAKLQEVLNIDPNFAGAKDLAYSLAQRDFNSAVYNINRGGFKLAATQLKRATSLMPTMISAWIKLGETYQKLGLSVSAKQAYVEALKVDPENKEARAMLGVNNEVSRMAVLSQPKQSKTIIAESRNSKDFVKESVSLVQGSKTAKGTSISSAIKSVLALTKSLGTKIYEDGWNVSSDGKGFLVRYACRQERGGRVEAENFDWKIDPDSKRITALSENSKLLMTRW